MPPSRRPVAAVALFILLATGAALLAAPAAAQEVPVEHTVSADEPGRVDVTTTVDAPSDAAGLTVVLPRRTDVYETEGFTRVDERTYEWTRSTDRPTLSYTMTGNVTVDRGAGERYTFVVTDGWALVRSPRVAVYDRTGRLAADQRHAVAGEGVAGPNVTYLGPAEVRTRDVEGVDQRLRLVVPAAADLRADPETVLDSMAGAAGRLPFGDPDEEVFVVAAPTTVEWAATGLQRGDADMWVRDTQRVAGPRNAWVHEYVHTRQEYEPTEATRWTIEGMADYYAALYSYEAGRIDHETFREKLEQGDRETHADVRLAEPDTWDDEADYEKGALVYGALDRRLRATADASVGGVVAEFGGGEVTQADLLDAIEAAGGADVRADARRYTETTATPSTWDRAAHAEAFGGAVFTRSVEGYAVDGPYRSEPLETPRLVAGERLETTVVVRNEGPDPGEYAVEFAVDGDLVETRRGRLAPGESTTLSFARGFETPGEYELRAGGTTATVTVEPPAEPRVTGLSAAPKTAAPGERVVLRATVVPAADRPAAGTVEFAVDGQPVAGTRVTATGETTIEATTTFETPGGYTVRAGDRASARVQVREGASASPTPAERAGAGRGGDGAVTTETDATGAAPGPVAVLAALAATLLLWGRR
jgi:hypothetical protein